MSAPERGWVRVLATVGSVVLLDQVTKAAVLASIARGDAVRVFFGLELTNVRNTGVAFGALSGSGAIVAVAVTVAISALLVFFALNASTPGLWLPVGLVFGGALGNLADRARIEAVIDFVDPAFWPAFNFADVAIVFGVLGVLYVAESR